MKRPSELGLTMPAEWESHAATWLAWPKNTLTFPSETIHRVENIYVEMIDSLAVGEKVKILVDDAIVEDRVRSMLSSGKQNLEFFWIKSADVWIRDYGPIFVKSKDGIAITKWNFNAWGRKYDDLLNDNETGLEISRTAGCEIIEPGIVLEGGSIDVNGEGLCLTTRQCLLNKNRNPKLSQGEIEEFLGEYLGARKGIIWLDEGIAGDDTDGHVDDIARFVSKNSVVCMVENNENDENYRILKRNHERLKGVQDHDGERLEVIPIQMPKPVRVENDGDERLPASYANFYIGNSVLLLPIFGEKNDEKAIGMLSDLFPRRKLVAIDCKALIQGFGGIHCVAQQEPASTPSV